MSRIISSLLLFIGFLFVYPQIYGTANAVDIAINPQQLSNKDSSGFDIKITGLITTNKYFIEIARGKEAEYALAVTGDNFNTPNSEGEISFHLCSDNPGAPGVSKYRIANPCGTSTFKEAIYVINVYEAPGMGNKVATSSFKVFTETSGKIEFTNDSWKTGDDIKIKVSDLSDGSYKIVVDGNNPKNGDSCADAKNGSFETNIGKYYEGSHLIQIYTNTGSTLQLGCGPGSLITLRTFIISNSEAGGPGPAVGVGTTSPANPKNCKKKGDPAFNKNTDIICAFGSGESCDVSRGPAIKTAIGCINTNPAELVKDILTFVVGIGGGLAFLMMLIGAFQMITSGGNPETLNAGKERLTSAVIGLLMVIFAILLLQIIGFDILKIPGFDR